MPVSGRPSRAAPAFAWGGALAFALSLLFFLHSYFVRFGSVPRSGSALRGSVVNVGLFTAFALHHSVFARPALKEWVVRVVPPALERSVYVWMASLLFAGVCASWRVLPGELYRLGGVAAGLGYAVQLLGIVLTARGSARLDVLDLAGVRSQLRSRTSDEPDRPRLETRGLYGFVRHPVYFAWLLLVFGTPHMTLSRFVFAAVSTAYIGIAIRFEERGLIRSFGAEYLAYQRQVRWRLIPGLY